MATRLRAPRGTRDILPGEIESWQWVESLARDVLERYGYREIRTPHLEFTELFARTVGAATDIVRKEMYVFERGGESVALRPEGTAPVVRAFVQHARYREVGEGFPDRLYYIGPMFRYERPQRGRLRQFHQLGAEVLGAEEPAADVEMIEMLSVFLDAAGLGDRTLLLNSVGDPACREPYREQLASWLRARADRLCSDCRRRAAENPLRVFDCKVPEDQALLQGAPRITDHLCRSCEEHFAEVRAGLEALGIEYTVDPGLVRGLDYYRRTVFEVVSGRLGAQNAVLGGGRYDGLVESLGGPPVPGLGFALGLERLLEAVGKPGEESRGQTLALVVVDPKDWAGAVEALRILRRRGLRLLAPLRWRPMGAVVKRARRHGIRFAVYVGEEELREGRYSVKDLESGTQESLDADALVARFAGGRTGG